MAIDRNPQAEQMGDESMLRTLAFQAQAIWPQEQALFDRYALAGPVHILDLGCGSGEITRRLAALEIGSSHGFAGFLGSQRNGRGIVFHVTELD